MAACRDGHHQVVELLLSNDLDVSTQDRDDLSTKNIISVFTEACYEGQHSSMMILLSKKLISFSNDKGKLLVAAAKGDIRALC